MNGKSSIWVQKHNSTCPEEERFGLEADSVKKEFVVLLDCKLRTSTKGDCVRGTAHTANSYPTLLVPHSWSTHLEPWVRTLHCRASTQQAVRMGKGLGLPSEKGRLNGSGIVMVGSWKGHHRKGICMLLRALVVMWVVGDFIYVQEECPDL